MCELPLISVPDCLPVLPSTQIYAKTISRHLKTFFFTSLCHLLVETSCRDNRTDSFMGSCPSEPIMEDMCPVTGFWPYFFSLQYFIFLKLVLMTLLYALFAATASRLQTETDNIWKYQRYILVVDFAHRLPLPAPLNIFHYIWFIIKWAYRLITCHFCCPKSRDTTDGRRRGKNNVMLPISVMDNDYDESKILSEEDYNFWRHLARQYSLKEELKDEDSNIAKKEWEAVQTITEEIEHEKKVLRQLKGKVTELERLMNQSHVYLESIKHLATKQWAMDVSTTSGSQQLVHFLARHSPYAGTRVQRVPIPDKYVAWEVMWIDYDPVAYSKPKMEFPLNVQHMVDEDILLLMELQVEEVIAKLPILQWNAKCVNPAGISIDRLSWIKNSDDQHVVYKLDNGIPLNPIGRTGLRGRGTLARWGPNHFVILIITRWQSLKMSNVLEFVVEKTIRRDQLSLPVRFIGGESLFLDLQSLFKTTENWTSSQEMTNFFKSAAIPSNAAVSAAITSPLGEQSVIDPVTGLVGPPTPGIKYERLSVGYMDDPYNTDNAWKEMELWHIHYTDADCLADRMQTDRIHWRIVTEDVFTKLPTSQATIMQDLTNKLKPTIL